VYSSKGNKSEYGKKKWMLSVVQNEQYSVTNSDKLEGNYKMYIQLFDTKSQKPVEIGLSPNWKENNFFLVQNVKF